MMSCHVGVEFVEALCSSIHCCLAPSICRRLLMHAFLAEIVRADTKNRRANGRAIAKRRTNAMASLVFSFIFPSLHILHDLNARAFMHLQSLDTCQIFGCSSEMPNLIFGSASRPTKSERRSRREHPAETRLRKKQTTQAAPLDHDLWLEQTMPIRKNQ